MEQPKRVMPKLLEEVSQAQGKMYDRGVYFCDRSEAQKYARPGDDIVSAYGGHLVLTPYAETEEVKV